MIVSNAFSINMLNKSVTCSFEQVTKAAAVEMLQQAPYRCCIGHADTAAVVGANLGLPMQAERATLVLDDEPMLVAQYRGPRLPEGTKTLPEGASIEYWLVKPAL